MISAMTLLLLIIFLVIPFIYVNEHFSYWKNRNIPYIKPIPIFGNILDIFLLKCNIAETMSTLYKKSKDPLIGIFMLHRPALLIKDPKLIKLFVIKYFDNFQYRSLAHSIDEEKDVDSTTSLVVSKYETWKIARKAVNPALSYNSLKPKFVKIYEITEKMLQYISKNLEKSNEINMREVSVRYSVDAVCECFFGIKAESFSRENSFFRLQVNRLFDYRVFDRGVNIAMSFISPQISKQFGFNFVDKIAGRRLVSVMMEELNRRKNNSLENDDYLQMLGHAAEKFTGKGNLVVGAAETFVAGYEAVSSALGFAFYELAKNQKIQHKLRLEILSGAGKGLDYELLNEMNYLDLFVKELLRMYPIVPFVDRVCTRELYLENPKIYIEEGISVYIPVLGIHLDPEFYPEPHKFYPERFLENKINWMVYLPFGKGPRMCPAKKYSEIVIKVCLAAVLSNFVLKMSPKSPKNMEFNTKGFSLQPSGDVFLRLESLK